MSQERRGTTRKHTYVPGFLYTVAGTALGKCIVKDISEQGALIIYPALTELPDEFVLTLGMNKQRCRVMWRRQKEVGVQFGAPKA